MRSPLLDHLSALADATRNRLLLLLERQELTVSELCAVTQLPQSTVSRHLKALADTGWITARSEGTRHLYAMPRHAGRGADGQHDTVRRLWQLVRDEVAAAPAAAQDQRRLDEVLAHRRSRSAEFFSSAAAEWDRLRDELFGDRFHVASLAALADPQWVVGDLGCGTGQTSAAISPFVTRVIAVDASSEMLQAAGGRLASRDNIDVRRGDLEALPIDDSALDLALVTLVLHHVADPLTALREAARVLKPAGRVVLIDMLPHDRESYRQQMGHVWLGFAAAQIETWLAEAGFLARTFVPLAAEPRAKGPALFVATGRRGPNPSSHTPSP